MDKHFLEKVFSNERMQRYFDLHAKNEAKAIIHYKVNIELSESFYPILTVFEIALRNSLNREMITHFNTTDWYLHISTVPGLKALNREITNASNLITKRHEVVTSSKIVAELTLGFWVRLLNAEYERILWKDLRRAFPCLPKKERQRNRVSAPINNIRNFRNRVFHHEPIAWNLRFTERIHADIYMVLEWLNRDLPAFVKPIDRYAIVCEQAKIKLNLK